GASCPAVDINAACTGFIYGLEMAAGLFALKKAKRILVLAAEALSRIVNWEDRSTCVLFGDGAGAVVLAPGEDLLYLHLTASGDDKLLYAPFQQGNYPGTSQAPLPYLHMDGGEVYKFAVNAILTGIQKALRQAGVEEKDVDHVILHQANLRIIEAAQKKLAIAAGCYHSNIQNVGNLSAASIPVLLDECNRQGLLKNNNLLVLSAFGGGLTTGTALLRWGAH
ncbi:MAG: 3-oxoacyl-[acyl-carrier-protein] synthase III C-terminal domain-containing protein, partial [Oscillospiraceae bacterium]